MRLVRDVGLIEFTAALGAISFTGRCDSTGFAGGDGLRDTAFGFTVGDTVTDMIPFPQIELTFISPEVGTLNVKGIHSQDTMKQS